MSFRENIDYDRLIKKYMSNDKDLDIEAQKFVDIVSRVSNLNKDQQEELFIHSKLLLIGQKYGCLLFMK